MDTQTLPACKPLLALFVALAFFLASTCAASAQQTGSIGFQVDAAHTGNLKTSPSFKPPLSKLWSVDLGGSISYPIIANGMVFVTVSGASNSGALLFALRATDGTTIWEKSIPSSYALSFITYANGVIYDLNYSGILQAYTASTGVPVWSIQIPGQYAFTDPPIAEGNSVFVTGAGNGGTLYRFNATNGHLQWSYDTYDGGGTPAIASNVVLVNAGCDTYSLNASSGRLIWHDSSSCLGGIGGDAAIAGQLGFVPEFNGNQTGGVVGLKTGILKDAIGSEVAAFDGKLALQTQGNMIATQLATGNIVWNFTPSDKLNVPPIIVNGVAYAISTAGNLYAVSAKSGELLQTLQPGVGKNPSDYSPVTPGLGAAPGILVVPSVSLLTAYGA